jgi:hypothetical protein
MRRCVGDVNDAQMCVLHDLDDLPMRALRVNDDIAHMRVTICD